MKKNNKICSGPCLPHCATDQRVLYLIIGFILGIFCYILVDRLINNVSEVNDKNSIDNTLKENYNNISENEKKKGVVPM
jgi:hypothetical protein